MSAQDWLARLEQVRGSHVAVVDGVTGERYTYSELNARATVLARVLVGRFGVGPGDRVAVLARNRIQQIDLYFAAQKTGAILVPLNWRLAPGELATIARDATPRVLFHDGELWAGALAIRAELPGLASVSLDGDKPEDYAGVLASAPRADLPEIGMAEGDAQMILYTSGTTGLPKGVIITHGQILYNSLNTGLACDLTSADVTVTYTPLFHTGGWHVLSTPLWHRGGTVILLPAFDEAAILEHIESCGVTCLFGVPTTFQRLLEHPEFPTRRLTSLRFSLCGGAPCPVWLIERYAERGLVFRQGFGMTEVGPNCFTLPPQDAPRKAGTVGFPMFHARARIVDEQGRPLGPGKVGELELAGPHVCRGYWNNPEATAQLVRQGWLRTGDLAVADEEGYYSIAGRAKDMFISGGENIYPAEVENVLATHPAVLEVAVIGVPDPNWGEVGRAVVVLREGKTATAADLTTFLDGRLARYKIPRSAVFVKELPRNASGKVIKASLCGLGR